MLCIHWICITLNHKYTRNTAAEIIWKQNTSAWKEVFSFSLRPAPSDYVCIKSTWGLSWELSRQAFPKRSWQWKSCVWILWGFFLPLLFAESFPKLHALIPSDKFTLDPPQHVTLALLGGKEHRPFISEERKSETYRKGWTWSTPRRSHLPQLYLSWEMHRNLMIQQYISEALYLGFNSSKNRPAFLRQNSLEHLLYFKKAIQYIMRQLENWKLLCVQRKNAMFFFIENARLLQGLKW